MQKRVAETLIKPVENEDFGAPFAEIAPKMIQKALPREGFRNAFSKRRKLIKPMKNTVSQNAKTRCEKPYKTNRK